MPQKLQGWTGSIRAWGKGQHSHEVIVSDEPPFADRRTYKAVTAVIHDGEHERVFTESEVKKVLEEFAIAGDMGRVQAMIIAKRHGIVLKPA